LEYCWSRAKIRAGQMAQWGKVYSINVKKTWIAFTCNARTPTGRWEADTGSQKPTSHLAWWQRTRNLTAHSCKSSSRNLTPSSVLFRNCTHVIYRYIHRQNPTNKREGKGREGKGREGKGREGKGREGKGREGKGREGDLTPLRYRYRMRNSALCEFLNMGWTIDREMVRLHILEPPGT
jgi:hypothetical protein